MNQLQTDLEERDQELKISSAKCDALQKQFEDVRRRNDELEAKLLLVSEQMSYMVNASLEREKAPTLGTSTSETTRPEASRSSTDTNTQDPVNQKTNMDLTEYNCVTGDG